jgi:charged multivesicular body protein 5
VEREPCPCRVTHHSEQAHSSQFDRDTQQCSIAPTLPLRARPVDGDPSTLYPDASQEAPPPPSLSDASAKIDSRTGALDEKIKKLDDELRRYKDQLKKAKGPAAVTLKKRAMDTLKRKKMYEAQRDQLAGQAFNVEQTAFAIDSVKDTQTTVAAMKAASGTLKQEFGNINLDDIEDTQDDLAEMMEDMNEVQDILGRSYAGQMDDIDDADLESELAGLEDELEGADTELDDAGATPSYLQPAALPEQPTGVPASPDPAVADATTDEFGLPVAPSAVGS